jgi:hypothetical protein
MANEDVRTKGELLYPSPSALDMAIRVTNVCRVFLFLKLPSSFHRQCLPSPNLQHGMQMQPGSGFEQKTTDCRTRQAIKEAT